MSKRLGYPINPIHRHTPHINNVHFIFYERSTSQGVFPLKKPWLPLASQMQWSDATSPSRTHSEPTWTTLGWFPMVNHITSYGTNGILDLGMPMVGDNDANGASSSLQGRILAENGSTDCFISVAPKIIRSGSRIARKSTAIDGWLTLAFPNKIQRSLEIRTLIQW